ncbi:hypothetical protein DRO97_01485 [Archaeoglobales archaeon]|nr:MAG: hypothetical protein DRO97_01485 [Archaeoglobales archaeon]
MSELSKIALPLVVLGFYPLVKLLSNLTINVPAHGPDIDVKLTILEFLWAFTLAISMLQFYRKVR